MASVYDNPDLQKAQTAASSATQAYNTAASDNVTLADSLRQALNDKLSTSNPLVQNRESALTNFLNTSTQAPLDYTAKSAGGNADVIYSPLQQANLIQARRSAALGPITTLNTLLGMQTGGIENIINAVSNANTARVKGLEGAATLANTDYTNLLDLLKAKADEAYKNASLSNNTNSLLNDPLLTALLGGALTPGQQASSYGEPKPTTSPAGFGNTNTKQIISSPGGHWVFDWQTNDWVPVTA